MAYALNTTYHFVSHEGTGNCLNVYGNETIAPERDVTVYPRSNTNAQKWQVRNDGTGDRIVNMLDTSMALNVYRKGSPWNCNMWRNDT